MCACCRLANDLVVTAVAESTDVGEGELLCPRYSFRSCGRVNGRSDVHITSDLYRVIQRYAFTGV